MSYHTLSCISTAEEFVNKHVTFSKAVDLNAQTMIN